MLTWYDMISWYYMIWHDMTCYSMNWQHTIQQLYPAIALDMHSSCRTSYLLRTCIIYYYHMCNYKQCSKNKTCQSWNLWHHRRYLSGKPQDVQPSSVSTAAFASVALVEFPEISTWRAGHLGLDPVLGAWEIDGSWAREGSWIDRSKDLLLLKTVESSTRKIISEDTYIDYIGSTEWMQFKEKHRIMNSQDHS